MPLFEYRCQDCGQIFEVFTQRQDRSAVPICPECGKPNVERMVSLFSATVSGGGSHATTSCGTG